VDAGIGSGNNLKSLVKDLRLFGTRTTEDCKLDIEAKIKMKAGVSYRADGCTKTGPAYGAGFIRPDQSDSTSNNTQQRKHKMSLEQYKQHT